MVPGFGPHTPSTSKPDYYFPRHEALEMVINGDAEFINSRGKAIRLKKVEAKIRDISCNVKQRIIHDFIQEKPYAVAIVEAWQGNHTAFQGVQP